jgi:hypothetical protein
LISLSACLKVAKQKSHRHFLGKAVQCPKDLLLTRRWRQARPETNTGLSGPALALLVLSGHELYTTDTVEPSSQHLINAS